MNNIVFTNGCFDIIHPGHLHILQLTHAIATNNNSRMVVGLNSDKSYRENKGKDPVFKQEDRLKLLQALKDVSEVIIFDDKTPIKLIKKLKPAIIVKGGDYKEEEVVGYKECQKWGGQVLVCPFEQGYSSSSIKKRIKETYNAG